MLKIQDVRQSYGKDAVLDGVSFELAPGDIGCLLGDSGCGKTTLLRCIAGFEHLSGGSIEIDGQAHSGNGQHRSPEERPVGLVFQDFALLPHLSVEKNIAFGLHDQPKATRAAPVKKMLELVGMAKYATRMPHELSGGQQQRVALARSLVRQPKLLLLDEPFSSLDSSLREQLGREVRDLLQELGMTALFVTHDQREAFSLADQIGILRHGKLLQWGRAYDVYHRPASREVADFIGGGAWLSGTRLSATAARTELGDLRGPMPDTIKDGDPLDILLRPDDVVHDDAALMQATITARHFRGATFLYELTLDDGTQLESLVPSHHNHAIGERIGIELDTEHMVVFPAR